MPSSIEKINNERNPYVDLLKILGILCIILAHVNPPCIIQQIRNFDVPLMVFLSGMLSVDSYKRSNGKLILYLLKRISRLLIPTYIFLTFYFLLEVLFGNFPGWKSIAKTYLFQLDSLGYTWIILVYLLCAIMVPILSKIDIHKWWHIGIIIVIYVFYETLCLFHFGYNIRFLYYTLYFAIPYGLILFLGMNYKKLSKVIKIVILLGSWSIYISCSILLYCSAQSELGLF